MNYKLRVSNNSNNDNIQSAKPLPAKPKENPIINVSTILTVLIMINSL